MRKLSSGPERGSVGVVLGVSAVVLFFLAVIAVVIAMALSVTVSGTSMLPTLHDGDRIEMDVLHHRGFHRFDIVEAETPGSADIGGGKQIVKRVIGLPGDQVAIVGGAHPVVLVEPKGQKRTYVVDNPAWRGQIGAAQSACCAAGGKGLQVTTAPAWVSVPAGAYWLLGDNYGGSTDSRVFGFVPARLVHARLAYRIGPRDRFGAIPDHVRLTPR